MDDVLRIVLLFIGIILAGSKVIDNRITGRLDHHFAL